MLGITQDARENVFREHKGGGFGKIGPKAEAMWQKGKTAAARRRAGGEKRKKAWYRGSQTGPN